MLMPSPYRTLSVNLRSLQVRTVQFFNNSKAGKLLLPGGLARKYPNAVAEWGWQWAFPQRDLSGKLSAQGAELSSVIERTPG
jgi:hypothetical protein